jgi:3,4-dihydroxy 2-butanone 4-phosphate synthase/GTP cyclohydrolase II
MIEFANWGVVIYLRQEGRGIGLVNKIKAYCLQDGGLDTVEANEKLGFGADLRTYGVGAQILHDLGIKKMRLITNNPRKIAGLKGFDIEIVGRLPLLIETNEYNLRYLETKAEKLGHLLLKTKLITLGVFWQEPSSPEIVEQLRAIASANDLLLQEESSPNLTNLFAPKSPELLSNLTIVHLGFDHSNESSEDWYAQPNHPYRQTVVRLFKELKQWQAVKNFKFFVAQEDMPSPELMAANEEAIINLGLVWHQPWLSDRLYEWFNFFLAAADLAIPSK